MDEIERVTHAHLKQQNHQQKHQRRKQPQKTSIKQKQTTATTSFSIWENVGIVETCLSLHKESKNINPLFCLQKQARLTS